MQTTRIPFAVRLVGFSQDDAAVFASVFEAERGKGFGYCHLADDNLQDPDIYVVNSARIKSSLILSQLPPSNVRPVLLVGEPDVELPYARIDAPIQWPGLFRALDELIEKRADALARLEASELILVPERRKRERLEPEVDPARYLHLRRALPVEGGILVIDKNPLFSDYMDELLARYKLPVMWAANNEDALTICREKAVAVVMLNTSVPGVDPYELCEAIRRESRVENTVVILLVSKPFVYEPEKANLAGASGFLNKPLASHHLISVLKKFLPSLMR
jgi:CheY-like chemotaxis protein